MMEIKDFAILAPVPLEHLQSGADIAHKTGFVAFGSRKWELFRKVDELRGSARVPGPDLSVARGRASEG
ncbi:hypothetical protein ACVWZM_009110 [Bradyrhizobium sp. USDA 4501]